MLKIKTPKSEDFRYMVEIGDIDSINDAFKIFMYKRHSLSFITDKHIIFLTKKEIRKCFKIFTISEGEKWKKQLCETEWSDKYSELFTQRVVTEMKLKNNPRWFYSLVEKGFESYIEANENQKGQLQ